MSQVIFPGADRKRRPPPPTRSIIYYRGFGEDPCFYVAEISPDSSKHFVGSGWLLQAQADLDAASRIRGASTVQKSTVPGGGSFVDIKDPLGYNIRLLYGITFRQKEEQQQEKPKAVIFNSWEDNPRKGKFQRFDSGPSRIHKLGHYGFVVDRSQYESSVAWYLNTFSLASPDILYDQATGKDIMIFMHINKGDEFTDHHLLGHYYLEKKGWTNCWGVGRHLLGSQIFDYWLNPSGNVVEHYSDGDVVNDHTPAP
ncbi:hypothetical protein B7463_g8979, partial [Scytalidium lignicola]